LYQLIPATAVAHSLDLTFDLAYVEFLNPWKIGGQVYVLTKKDLRYQVNYIQQHHINFWLMTPSNAQSLIRFGLLKQNSLPDLKITIFGGEPLPESFIPEWRKAAPNTEIKHGIGSTECQNVA